MKNKNKREKNMTNNRQRIEHDFIIPFRNNTYGVIIHWGGRMETDENGNRLGLSAPYITLSRGSVNVMGYLENIQEVFELEIDPNHAWSNLREHIRELIEQRYIENLRSLSEDQINNLPTEDLNLLTEERA